VKDKITNFKIIKTQTLVVNTCINVDIVFLLHAVNKKRKM